MNKPELHRQVAQLHAANLDRGFLSLLGTDFLASMYRAIDEAGESVLLVEERDGRIVGFIAGSLGMGPIYRRMLRRPFSLAWSLLPSLVRPRRLRKIFDILRYGGGEKFDPGLPAAELLSIAVDRQFRGKGIAETLYRRLVEHFDQAGLAAFRIVVGAALSPAHRFYARMGAVPVSEIELHADQRSVVYIHAIGVRDGGRTA